MTHTPPALFAQIALPIPRHTLFTYSIPPELHSRSLPGWSALVPFGRVTRIGLVWQVVESPPWNQGEIRPILDILGTAPLLDSSLRHLLEWMSRYYLHPIGSVVATALPGFLLHERKRRYLWKKEKAVQQSQPLTALSPPLQKVAEALAKRSRGLGEATLLAHFGKKTVDSAIKQLLELGVIDAEEIWQTKQRQPEKELVEELLPFSPPPDLNAEQQLCVQAIQTALATRQYAPFLLDGVTGSGKTEVYLQAVEAALQRGRQSLLLVPEIALTPQLIGRFRRRFGDQAAVLHSGLGERQRHLSWQRLQAGQCQVAIGARSALFAPLPRLGLLVVDEEHDSSYKQEEGVTYHARDMAVVRARQAGAVIILGSATPSLESLVNAQRGRYQLLRLSQRATGVALPRVEVLNLRDPLVRGDSPRSALISPALRTAVNEVLAQGRQALLFLNRRGFSPSLLCSRCGWTANCPHCSVALTLHQARHRLLCHYCNNSQEIIDLCPQCGQLSLVQFGPGTERLEQESLATFPSARIARLDRDTVSDGGRDELERILTAFTGGDLDILVGTQMATKGHHFPNLALVGVILAEGSLYQPDFRAAERTFQLLTQVAGRAGREEQVGRVLVQSYDPGHYAVQAAIVHNPGYFIRTELAYRREAGYPPFCRLALMRFSAPLAHVVEEYCAQVKPLLRPVAEGIDILGPAPATIHKLRGRYRWQLLIKDRSGGNLHRTVSALLDRLTKLAAGQIRIEVDIDPYLF